MRIYRCDRCEKVYSFVGMEKATVNNREVTITFLGGDRVDLCGECVGSLGKWLLEPKLG